MRKSVAPEIILGMTDARMAKAVRIGHLWHDASAVEHVVERYCRTIFVYNHCDEYQFSLRGSGSAVRIGGKNTLFCCHHQIHDLNPEDIYMQRASSQNYISAKHMIFPTVDSSNEEEEYIDCRGLRFVDDEDTSDLMSRDFFPVLMKDSWPNNSCGKFILFGYPFHLQNVDYSPEVSQIERHKIFRLANYDNASQAAFTHRLKLDDAPEMKMDGVSGGPVFHMGKDRAGYFLGFAGMVLRGGNPSNYIHFVEIDFLVKMMKHPG